MAENETAGTLLEKYFGEGAYASTYGAITNALFGTGATGGVGVEGYLAQAGTRNVTIPQLQQSTIADLVRSGQLSRSEVSKLTGWQLATLGTQGYMELYPEVFAPPFGATGNQFYMSREQMEIASLAAMSRQITGIGGTFARWLIDNRIRELEYKIAQDRYSRGAISARPELNLREAPIQEWMRKYIEGGEPPAQTATETYGRRRRETTKTTPTITGRLRPIGAQEELTPEQQTMLAAYQAWGRAGYPTSMRNVNKQALLQSLLDTSTWWPAFTAESQKLFPSARNTRSTWAITKQR